MKQILNQTTHQNPKSSLTQLKELIAQKYPDLKTNLTSETLQIILPGARQVGMVIMADSAEVAGTVSTEQASLIPALMDVCERKVILTRIHNAWPLMLELAGHGAQVSYVNRGPWMHLILPGGSAPIRIGGRVMAKESLEPQALLDLLHEGEKLTQPEECDQPLGKLALTRAFLRGFFRLMARKQEETGETPSPLVALAHWYHEQAWRSFMTVDNYGQSRELLEGVTDSGPEGLLIRWIKEAESQQPAPAPRPRQTHAELELGGTTQNQGQRRVPVAPVTTVELESLKF